MPVTNFFAGYSLLDGTSIIVSQDTELNAELTKGVKWEIVGFAVIVWLLSCIAIIPLFFTLPILYLARIHAYKQLKSFTKTEDPHKAHEV